MLQDVGEIGSAVNNGSVDELHFGGAPEHKEREARVLDVKRGCLDMPVGLMMILLD